MIYDIYRLFPGYYMKQFAATCDFGIISLNHHQTVSTLIMYCYNVTIAFVINNHSLRFSHTSKLDLLDFVNNDKSTEICPKPVCVHIEVLVSCEERLNRNFVSGVLRYQFENIFNKSKLEMYAQ